MVDVFDTHCTTMLFQHGPWTRAVNTGSVYRPLSTRPSSRTYKMHPRTKFQRNRTIPRRSYCDLIKFICAPCAILDLAGSGFSQFRSFRKPIIYQRIKFYTTESGNARLKVTDHLATFSCPFLERRGTVHPTARRWVDKTTSNSKKT